MKKIISAVMLLAICVCTFTACGNKAEFSDKETLSKGYERNSDITQTYNYADGSVDQPYLYNSYANLITNFELKMLRQRLAQSGGEGFVFSPAGTALQLSLLANGASDNTLTEIMLALGSELDVDSLNQCSSYFKSRMESVGTSGAGQTDELSGKKPEKDSGQFVRLNSALFFNDTTDVRTPFLQKNADFYGSDIFRFDFGADAAKEKTENYFENKYALDLNAEDGLIAAHSTEISDLWLEPYSKAQIHSGVFKGEGKETETAFMLSSESRVHSENAEGIIKYTSVNPLKLVLIMPNEGTSLSDYIKTFDVVEYTSLLESVDITKKVSADIPQFSVKSGSESASLSEILTQCGLYTLFSENADFGNLAHTDGLMLNGMYNLTASLSVTANGIDSGLSNSASTADDALLSGKDAADGTNITEAEIKFDRPFIFLLIDNESSIPVLAGAYC